MKKNYPRNMVGYGKKLPEVVWPNNAKLALQIVLNYEEGSENCVLHNDKHSETFLSEIIGEIIGFDRNERSEACEFVSSITGDNSREVVSFGTEAGLFQEIGISTAVCGPGSIDQAHKIDEFIKLEEINKCLNFLNGVKDKSIQN